MKHHSKLSPSAFPALMQCACFKHHEESDKDADKGTQLHDYIEDCLVGKTPRIGDQLEQADIDDCENMVEQIKGFCELHQPGCPIEVEQKVEVLDDSGEVVTFGTKDVRCGKITIDLKSCFDFDTEVDKHVPQVDIYALADMRDQFFDEAICAIGFIKPGRLVDWTRTRVEAEATLACVLQRVEDPYRHPQVCQYCKYCAGIMCCSAVNERIGPVLQSFGGALDLDMMLVPEQEEDPERLCALLTYARNTVRAYVKRLEKIADNIESAVLAKSETLQIPHYERISKSGKKKVSDPEKARELLALDNGAFAKAVTVSLPKLSQVYGEANGLKEKEARKLVEGILFDVIGTGEPTIELEWVK